ncbi:MAG: SDR family NAD(P)-dependent oxidoreductase [Thermoplasmatota archaeon]
MDLEGKRVLVTGATAGIGEATARAFVEAGAHVVLAARRRERLDALVEELGDRAEALVLDVADRAAVEAAPAGAFEVDILVNNAGLARGTDPLHTADPSDWEEMVDTNVLGLLYVTRRVAAGMAARGEGHIVNLGSVAGRWTYPGGGVYCATKHAVRALSEGLRMDLHGSGVRVTNIEPGLVETEFSMVRFGGDEQRAAAVYEGTRALSAQDVAETILWCCGRPAHVNVQELVLFPTDQASVGMVLRA